MPRFGLTSQNNQLDYGLCFEIETESQFQLAGANTTQHFAPKATPSLETR